MEDVVKEMVVVETCNSMVAEDTVKVVVEIYSSMAVEDI